MFRIIVKCLLLASIVAAAPDGRDKRHFSFIKDLITSTLFGASSSQRALPPPPVLQTDTEYELYRVPGFDDVLIRAKPNTYIEETIISQPEELEINPFESYIGTKNTQDTVVALQNVNNLLSTEILTIQESNLMRETILPIISSVGDSHYMVKGHLGTVPVLKETFEAEVIKPSETEVKYKVPFETKYSYKQLEKNEPVMTFTARNNPEVIVRQRIDLASSLPMCVKERIDGVVSLGANPHQIYQAAIGQYPHFVEKVSPRTNEPMRVVLLHKSEPNSEKTNKYAANPPVKHLKDLGRNQEAKTIQSTPKKNTASKDNKIDILQTLGPMPPQYISQINSKPQKAEKEIKTNVKPTENNVKANSIKIENIVSAADHIAEDGTVSHYVYKQVSHQNPSSFSLTKQKDEADMPVNTKSPMETQYVFIPPVVNNNPVNPTASDGLHTNKVSSEKGGSNTPKGNPELLKEKESFRNNPIVVKEGNYVYRLNKNDGNIISVRKDKEGVTVDVNQKSKNRGDIPGQ